MANENFDRVTIVFVVHGGELEIKAALLACSLRYRLGDEVEIIAALATPESVWGSISDHSRTLYRKLNIALREIENPFGADYPIGNKFAAVGIEPTRPYTLFLDSDILCWQAFDVSDLLKHDACVKPADLALVPKHQNFWQSLYAHIDQPAPSSCVVTSYSQEVIPDYFNAGVMLIREAAVFARHWLDIARRLDADDAIEHKFPWLDQLALPLAFCALKYDVQALSERYNYPLHLKPMPDDQWPFLLHYHDFDVILREPSASQFVTDLLETYSELSQLVEEKTDYHLLLKGLRKPQKRSLLNKWRVTKDPVHELIITGIPRSGTSYICRLLSDRPETVVINEHPDVFRRMSEPLAPWGMAVFYGELRRDILLKRGVLNKHNNGRLVEDTAVEGDMSAPYYKDVTTAQFTLGTKNTLAYLVRLPMLRKTMPKARIIAAIRHPYDTLLSWSNTFEHLQKGLIECQPLGHLNDPYLSSWQKRRVQEIMDAASTVVKRALWWRYLAQLLDQAGEDIQLIRYEELVESPAVLEDALNGQHRPVRTRFAGKKTMPAAEREITANIVCEMADRFQYIL